MIEIGSLAVGILQIDVKTGSRCVANIGHLRKTQGDKPFRTLLLQGAKTVVCRMVSSRENTRPRNPKIRPKIRKEKWLANVVRE